MQELILKKEISKSKIEALINFLKSWDIDAELKVSTEITPKKKSDFSLSAGLWEDYNIEGNELRKKAWTRNL